MSNHKPQAETVVPKRGMSYGAIAEAIGRPKSAVHRWMTGQSIPRASAMTDLAKALGMSERALVAKLYAARSKAGAA
jgi:transcriptional regulator with XRE-family HTH domain